MSTAADREEKAMPLSYCVIEVYTSEEARWQRQPLWEAIMERVVKAQAASRCLVFKGVAGAYENGELSSSHLEILSYNMPIKLEIVVPTAECERLLDELAPIVTDGIVAVRDAHVRVHRVKHRLIPRQLRARDVMTDEPTTVREDTPVSQIIPTLLTAEFNAVPVVDAEQRPVGIITQRDLIERAHMPIRLGLLAELEQPQLDEYLANIAHMKAAEVMTSPVVTVEEDRRLDQVAQLMLRRNLKRFPVVDSEGRLLGMLARLDIFGTIAERAEQARALEERKVDVGQVATVGDIMAREQATATPHATGAEVLELLRTRGIQRVAVVDDDGRLLGLITDGDLLTALSGPRGGVWDYLSRRPDMLKVAETTTAADIMVKDLTTVREDTPVAQAIRLMSEHGHKRLPVVDEKGRFEGMVSRQSLLAAGARHDE